MMESNSLNRRKLGACLTVAVVAVGVVLTAGVFSNQASNQLASQKKNSNSSSRYETPPSQWHSPPSVSIGQGFGVGSADYIIFKGDEGNVYAKSGDNGQIMYESSALDPVFENADASGKKIYISPGTYVLSGPDKEPSSALNPENNTLVCGAGKSTILKIDDNTQINAVQVDNKENIRISNLFIDGNKQNQPSANFKKNGSAAEEEQWLNGIKLENCYNCKVVGVTVKDTPNNAIQLYHGTSESAVVNCRVENTEWHGIQIWDGLSGSEAPTEYNTVSSNYVEGNYGSGIGCERNGKADFNTIIGNTVVNCAENTAASIGVNTADFINIDSNVVRGGIRGMSLTGTHINVTNNNFADTSPTISIYPGSAHDVNITANNFSSVPDTVILVDGTCLTDSVISSNSSQSSDEFLKIYDPSATCDNILITGNKVQDTGTNAVFLQSTVDTTVTGNKFTDITNNALVLSTGTQHINVVNNTFNGVEQKAVTEGGGENNYIANNIIRNTPSPSLDIASPRTEVKNNYGFVNGQSGLSRDAVPIDSAGLQTLTVSFPNTFDNIPETVNATLQNFDNDSAVAYVAQVSDITADNFTLKVFVKTASATSGDDADVSWRALDNRAY